MISLRGISKTYGMFLTRNDVLTGIDATFEAGKHYVVFGDRGSGKTTLLKIMSGLIHPTSGKVVRRGIVSLPIGTLSRAAKRETPRQLATYFANVYGCDPRQMVHFVATVADIRDSLDTDTHSLGTNRRARMNFAIGYGIPADCYLFDGLIGVGDQHHRELFAAAFAERRKTATTIVMTREVRNAEQLGEVGAVLHNGRLAMFSTVAEASRYYEQTLSSTAAAPVATRKGRSQTPPHAARTPETNAQFADRALREGRFANAVDFAWLSLDQARDAPLPYFVLARVAEREGRTLDTIAYAERVLDLSPDHREASVLLAKTYEAIDLNQEAAQAWRAIAAQTGGESIALRLSIRNDEKAGNWARVVDSCDFGLASNPGNAGLLDMRLRALQELGRWDEALATLGELGRGDLEKAIGAVFRLTKGEDWHRIGACLKTLEEIDRAGMRGARGLTHILLFLRRRAALETQAGAADRAAAMLAIVNTYAPQKV